MQAPSGVVYRSWSPQLDEFGNRDLATDLPAARGARPGGCDVTAQHDPSARPITVLLDPAAVRRGHLELARQLGVPGRLCRGRAPAQPLPSALALLIWFERHVLGAAGGAIDPVEDLTFDASGEPEARDVVIDLAGRAAPQPGGRTLRVLFDGIPGECGLFAAIMRGAAPTIEIEAVERGVVVASGTPATDNAGAVSEAYEFIWARVVTLLRKALSADGGVAPVRCVEASPLSTAEIITRQIKLIGCDAVRRLYRMCCYAPHWRTMWRRCDGAASPTPSLAGGAWQVLPDPGVRFFADPFPIVHDGRVFLFVEDLDHRVQKAVISVVAFDQNGPVGEVRPVLEEPWHLSYPFVFAHDGDIWMIPESTANRTVSLYRADPFPTRWVHEAVLIEGVEASDATLVQHGGRFWLFAATRDHGGSWSDTLSIFMAPTLRGPWRPHPANPILIDSAAARPAGAMFHQGGQLWRPVQNCSRGYGTGIGFAEVTRLDGEGFAQVLRSQLAPDPAWPGRRLHTFNRAGGFEFIDGSAHAPRSATMARLLEPWSGRRGTL